MTQMTQITQKTLKTLSQMPNMKSLSLTAMRLSFLAIVLSYVVAGAAQEPPYRMAGRQFDYYAPGLYTQDTIHVRSNTTVYLAGGSYFTGTFAIEDAENVSILGRGVARPSSGYEGCHVHRSRNVVVEGITLNTCPVGGSDGVVIRDVHSISHPAWGDGLNVFASSNVTWAITWRGLFSSRRVVSRRVDE